MKELEIKTTKNERKKKKSILRHLLLQNVSLELINKTYGPIS